MLTPGEMTHDEVTAECLRRGQRIYTLSARVEFLEALIRKAGIDIPPYADDNAAHGLASSLNWTGEPTIKTSQALFPHEQP